MGISLFKLSGSASFSGKKWSGGTEPQKPRPGEPDPLKFKIVKTMKSWHDKYVLAKVTYPNCVNFAGSKIMIVESTLRDFKAQKSLDPHFLEEGSKTKVIARLRPTDEGWEQGVALLRVLDPI